MKVCFTGGGTGGHIFPVFAVDSQLISLTNQTGECYQRFWLGSRSLQEKSWVTEAGIPHISIQTGKLRRYVSWKFFPDMVHVVIGFFQALKILHKEQPDVLFSKGGFVSVPPVIAARLLKIPTITHESDAIPGLATIINIRFADVVCIPFEEAIEAYPKKIQHKVIVTGVPTRMHLEQGNAARALHKFGFSELRPVLLILGGSQGALQINNLVWDSLEELLKIGQIIHQTGERTFRTIEREGYVAIPFIDNALEDILAATSVVVSRSGATALADFLEMQVPMVLIPLGLHASRGDQIENARRLATSGAAVVIEGEEITKEYFVSVVKNLVLLDSKRRGMLEAARAFQMSGADRKIAETVIQLARRKSGRRREAHG